MSSVDKADTLIKFPKSQVKPLAPLTFEQQSLLTWTALFVFLSIFIAITIIIWTFVILKLISWQTALIFTVIGYVIFYGLSVLYRFFAAKDIQKSSK